MASNPYTVLNLNTVHWDWLVDHENQLANHESSDVDIDTAFDDADNASQLAKLLSEYNLTTIGNYNDR